MHVATFRAIDFEGVKDVELIPGQVGLILIGGENDAGKSSVLDALAVAVGGGKLMPERPVRIGEEQAVLECQIDDVDGRKLSVRRTVKADGGGSLEVRDAEGRKFSAPQKVLDGITSAFAFDPLAFESAKPQEQRDLLLKCSGLGSGLGPVLATLDAERARLVSERLLVGREGKAAAGHLASLPAEGPVPEPVDVEPIRARLSEIKASQVRASALATEAKHAHADAEQRKRDVERLVWEAESVASQEKSEAAELDRLIALRAERSKAAAAKLERSRAAQDDARLALAAAVAAADEKTLAAEAAVVEDPVLVEAEVKVAEVRNRQRETALRARSDREAASKNVEAKRANYAGLTRAIADVDARKTEAVEGATFPVAGLSVSSDVSDADGNVTQKGGVTLNGVPFAQASGSARLRASFGIAVAQFAPQGLRIAICKHGERLGKANLEALRETAQEYGCQFFVERVGDTDDGAIIIEEGRVRGS